MKKILVIAGSDSSGGAGIQTDLRTIAKHNLYGTTALTVIVAMSEKDWTHSVFPVALDTLKAQLDTAFLGLELNGIKTGMIPTPESIELVASYLKKAKGTMPIVIDPVMACKGNKPLHLDQASKIRTDLIQYATVTTPNVIEAAELAQMEPLTSLEEAREAAKKIMAIAGCESVVITHVGKLTEPKTADDLFYDGKEFTLIEGKYIDTTHTHGLGCTFASHIAANLVKGYSPKEATQKAKAAIAKGIEKHFALNQHAGTLYFPASFAN